MRVFVEACCVHEARICFFDSFRSWEIVRFCLHWRFCSIMLSSALQSQASVLGRSPPPDSHACLPELVRVGTFLSVNVHILLLVDIGEAETSAREARSDLHGTSCSAVIEIVANEIHYVHLRFTLWLPCVLLFVSARIVTGNRGNCALQTQSRQ